MKLAIVSFIAVCAAALGADAATPATTNKIAADCNQDQRRLVNQLLQQDVNPAKACYAKAKGDITTLSTSRLCPIAECKVWLEFMAEKAPDCVYDDTNFGREFRDKYQDCLDPSAKSGSSDGTTSKPSKTTKPSKATKAPSSSSGSDSTSGSAGDPEPTPTPTTTAPAESSSGSTEIEIPETTAPTVEFPTETPAPPPATQSGAAAVGVTVCAAAVTTVVASLVL